jgi:flavin-dependent thymidylate synthase
MRVNLAGFNLDTAVIGRLRCHDDVTPETLSAAYARMSRCPEPAPELRRVARAEVEKARKSNRTIVFQMGHHSVAEHAVFNFDIVGLSRLALEELEHFRLVSYTEKSQRYIRMGQSHKARCRRDRFLPEEFTGGLRNSFRALAAKQFSLYEKLYDKVYQHCLGNQTSRTAKRAARLVASEDARYVLPLATLSQVGMTVNARNLELMIRRSASHPLAEVRELGKRLCSLASRVAPSLIIFTGRNPHGAETYTELRQVAAGLDLPRGKSSAVRLLSYTKQADDFLLTTILHHCSAASFRNCGRAVGTLDPEGKRALILKTFEHAELYDAVLREFEVVSLTFELVVSASCFAQLKRHRMATVLPQRYNPELGVTIPGSIRAIRGAAPFRRRAEEASALFWQLIEQCPDAAQYVLTNGHRKRVLFHCNARELYHVSRLRQDSHAQWEIRDLADKMGEQAKRAAPLTTLFLAGKHAYPGLYRERFGRLPKVVRAELPGARSLGRGAGERGC